MCRRRCAKGRQIKEIEEQTGAINTAGRAGDTPFGWRSAEKDCAPRLWVIFGERSQQCELSEEDKKLAPSDDGCGTPGARSNRTKDQTKNEGITAGRYVSAAGCLSQCAENKKIESEHDFWRRASCHLKDVQDQALQTPDQSAPNNSQERNVSPKPTNCGKPKLARPELYGVSNLHARVAR